VVRVKPGLPVYFTILGEPDRRYQARLRSIDPAPQSYSDSSDSTSTSSTSTSSSSSSSSSTAIYYYGLFDVPNPGHKLRINMTAQVSVVLSQAQGVLAIPANALGVRGKDGRYAVRVLQPDGSVQPRAVKIGLNNNVHAQVLSGLRAGEQVIVGEASATPAAAAATTARRRWGCKPCALPCWNCPACREFASGEDTVTVLDNINLQIQAGEMVAIIGASGLANPR
jgi:macrolide-specific efflux system membrane fusion protein